MLEGVMASGVATWSDDLMLPVVTDGRPQERYFTFTYSPIPTDAGTIEGIFCAVDETTQRVLSEGRLEVLNDLAAALIDADSSRRVEAALQVCAARPADLPFVAISLSIPSTPSGTAARDDVAGEGAGRASLSDFGVVEPARR